MAENDRCWPKGFFDELVAMSGADLDDLPLSARLEDMYQRAAEELTAAVIADPRRVLGEQAGQRAAFEARLEARWGRGLDLADLVIHDALESGMWAHGLVGPAAAACLWVPIIRSWALTRGFALHPGTRNRYMMRYTRTQYRPASRHVNDHGRVSGTHVCPEGK